MEKLIYDLVKDRPWLKDWLKKIYQHIFSLMGRQREVLPEGMVIRPNTFFGFHDKSPWSADNTLLLGHQYIGTGNEQEVATRKIDIVIFSGENWLTPTKIATTSAWNWQQGAQLQWKGENILFNDFINGECRAVEVDKFGQVIKVHKYAVGAISPIDKAMASYCFKHFGDVMPGYGYDFNGASAKSNIAADTLLIILDDGHKEVELLGHELPGVVFGEVILGEPFISHALFSPDGKKLAFMRRLAVPGRRRRSALYIFDRANQSVVRVPFKDMVSHFCWLSDNVIFAYANTENGDGYYQYQIQSDQLIPFTNKLKSVDGHPHAEMTGKKVVFDTYPDKRRLQQLAVYDFQSQSLNEIAKLYSPMKFWDGKRVDLHPRFRPDGSYVCIDCSTTGVRALATLNVNGLSQ